MRYRGFFISNSSSTCFVVPLGSFDKEDRRRIRLLSDLTFETTRCTGRITDVRSYLAMLDSAGCALDDAPRILKLLDRYPDLVILRESDEGMGGTFQNVGLSPRCLQRKALLTYEYH
jgi:hypothetical protein